VKAASPAKALDLISLVKPRIMIMALLTAAGALSLAPGDAPAARVLWLLAGTALIVGSANTLNMWLERDVDCLMARTRNRPLPQGRLEAATALRFGGVLGAGGRAPAPGGPRGNPPRRQGPPPG
jgi:protoheme IX farnesyltransferase